MHWGPKQDDPDYHDSSSDSSDSETNQSNEKNYSELPDKSNVPSSNQDSKNEEENRLKNSLLVHWGPKCNSSDSQVIVHNGGGLLADWGSSSNSFLPWDATSNAQEKDDNNKDAVRDGSSPNAAESPTSNECE